MFRPMASWMLKGWQVEYQPCTLILRRSFTLTLANLASKTVCRSRNTFSLAGPTMGKAFGCHYQVRDFLHWPSLVHLTLVSISFFYQKCQAREHFSNTKAYFVWLQGQGPLRGIWKHSLQLSHPIHIFRRLWLMRETDCILKVKL